MAPLASCQWTKDFQASRHLAIQSGFHLGKLDGELKSTPFGASPSARFKARRPPRPPGSLTEQNLRKQNLRQY